MQDTIFRTVTLPPLALANEGNANLIAVATKVAVRVLLSNLSGATMFFGTASESMIGPGAPGTQVFPLLAGQGQIFILAPGQQLFGSANGAGGQLAISISEAMPLG